MRKVIKFILKPIFNLMVLVGVGIAGAVCLLCDFIDLVLGEEVE